MKNRIEIETGNEAMQDGRDVAKLLRNYSIKIGADVDSGLTASGKMFDVNGNTVGTWEVEN